MTTAGFRSFAASSTLAIAALVGGTLVSTLAAEEANDAAARRCLACGTAQRAALESLAPQRDAPDEDEDGVALTNLSSIRTLGSEVSSRRRTAGTRTDHVATPAARFAALMLDTPWPLLPLALEREGFFRPHDGAGMAGGLRDRLRTRPARRQPAGPVPPARVNPLR